MLFDPSSFAIPVRILKDPEPSQLLVTTLTMAGTFLLGVLASPITVSITSWMGYRRKLADIKRDIYDELARYVAAIDRIPENASIGRDTMTSLMLPRWPTFHEYEENEFVMLLRFDKERGIMNLIKFIDSKCSLIMAMELSFHTFWEYAKSLRKQIERSSEMG